MNTFTDLIILVGTNPLPNYVVVKYFLRENKQFQRTWLVHSEEVSRINQKGTKQLAENIRQIIRQETEKMDIKYVSLSDIADARSIESDIKRNLFDKLPSGAKLHLNYTGGTKAMAVHVYRTLENISEGKCTFSYLNARNFRIHEDQGRFHTGDLRETISLSLENLIKLHGSIWDRTEEDKVWPNVDKACVHLIDNGYISDYLNWLDSFIEPLYYANGKKFSSLKQLREHIEVLKQDGSWDKFERIFKETPNWIMEILRSFPQEYSPLQLDGSIWIPGEEDSKTVFKKRFETPVHNYLVGKWLEKYIADVIKKNADSEGLGWLIDKNWFIKNQGYEKKFELDVICMNGYQVCGISCTVDRTEAICKSKGFEVLTRVEQIGGEEGKAVLITCLKKDSVGTVQNDLEKIRGSWDNKLLVLGIEDLQEEILWKKIKEHIKGGD